MTQLGLPVRLGHWLELPSVLGQTGTTSPGTQRLQGCCLHSIKALLPASERESSKRPSTSGSSGTSGSGLSPWAAAVDGLPRPLTWPQSLTCRLLTALSGPLPGVSRLHPVPSWLRTIVKAKALDAFPPNTAQLMQMVTLRRRTKIPALTRKRDPEGTSRGDFPQPSLLYISTQHIQIGLLSGTA